MFSRCVLANRIATGAWGQMNAITGQYTFSIQEKKKGKWERTVAGDCPVESTRYRSLGKDTYDCVLQCGPWNGGRDDR
jgi:hypothetical protein